ncbi:hypothetical protein MPSEU_000513900 [Mayamaea pseudoterrestris]|nr:hypothetical protein MPSEU_000513900 [Mayamaea pseudoterrestris]
MEASSSPPAPLSSIVGNAVILLSDWDRFGLEERSLYHFDLSHFASFADDLGASDDSANRHEEKVKERMDSNTRPCGFKYLLECVPKDVRLRSEQKRKLKSDVKALNSKKVKQTTICYQPMHLPLKISPTSAIYFTYETTRMAFVLDASPTLTSTFGYSQFQHDPACCPLDRLAGMACTFFESLVKPVRAPISAKKGIWRPLLAVSVVAVLPRQVSDAVPKTILLVRDFRVSDEVTARELAERIDFWVLTMVEQEIAHSLGRRSERSSFCDLGSVPSCTTLLKDLLHAGDAALNSLSSSARPMIVVATDGRAVVCDSSIEILSDVNRVDVPLVVLDLSSKESHISLHNLSQQGFPESTSTISRDPFVAIGDAFPLHYSDDTEAIYAICKATGGCFYDKTLLDEAATSLTGEVQSESDKFHDVFCSYKRHLLRINAVQWYTLFSLSPLTPTVGMQLARLAPPLYLRQKALKSKETDSSLKRKSENITGMDAIAITRNNLSVGLVHDKRKLITARSILATYFVNPVKIKSLLVMRIKEGYLIKQYGSSTFDSDKILIQFTLQADVGATILYELSYRALPGHRNKVGFAHIKIELYGEQSFLQKVKQDYLAPGELHSSSQVTAQKLSQSLCRLLHSVRRDDMLMPYLSPVRWGDHLSTSDTPFIRLLSSLTRIQKQRHFRVDTFDVVVAKNATIVSGSLTFGEDQLVRVLIHWATQTLPNGHSVVKHVISSAGLPVYCLVEIEKGAQCLFSVSVLTSGGTEVGLRLYLLSSLLQELRAKQESSVLKKMMSTSIVGMRLTKAHYSKYLEQQISRTSWNLDNDPELLPLLVKRRTGVDGFTLLEETGDVYCLLAKFLPSTARNSFFDEPGDLVQYEVHKSNDCFRVDIYMESESSKFRLRHPWLSDDLTPLIFTRMVDTLRTKDKACGRALQCRTTLKSLLDGAVIQDPWVYAKRLLKHAQRFSTKLRCFGTRRSGKADDILYALTRISLLNGCLGARVAGLSTGDGYNIPELPCQMNRPASWYFLEHALGTVSVAYLTSTISNDKSEAAPTFSYYDLVIFAVQVSNIYSRRDAMSGELSADAPAIPDSVLTFASHVERSHRLNISAAAYLALLNDEETFFEEDQVRQILQPLHFLNVCSLKTTACSELRALLAIKLRYVVDGLYFYNEETDLSPVVHQKIDDESDNFTLHSVADDETDSDDGEPPQVQSGRQDTFEGTLSTIAAYAPDPPLFARITGLEHDDGISRQVSIFLSVFDTSRSSLPDSHCRAANELSTLLNSFVAERTLERLRHQGQSISDGELRTVKSCLRQARNVALSCMELNVYVGTLDAMVAACAPVGCGREVEEAFTLMLSLLCRNDQLAFVPHAGGGFAILETEKTSSALAFFAFVEVNKAHQIIIQVHHPSGSNASAETLSMIRGLILAICLRTNQILLLKRLHVTRVASTLLIPNLPSTDLSASALNPIGTLAFSPGAFRCPMVFEYSFTVFYRCAASLPQIARAVKSTVLHPFTINNNRSHFVYKDESESVFYMELAPREDNQIVLLVYGVCEPCLSVTSQLTALIDKKLLQIAVDTLSSLLTKNSHYIWKDKDLEFVQKFEEVWTKVDLGREFNAPQERVYTFDGQLFDRGFLMLFFRQNLCGSSFFHVLNHASAALRTPLEDGTTDIPSLFFYNNAPATLDPKLQPNSTLTVEGAEYARMAGTGVAIIEVQFSTKTSDSVRESVSNHVSELPYPVLLPAVHAHDSTGIIGDHDLWVRVKVTSTALHRDAVHRWVKLTLDQVLLSSTIERHIELMQSRIAAPGVSTVAELSSNYEARRCNAIESVCPGLPLLEELLATESPHPGILKSIHLGLIRSSDVATVALDSVDLIISQLVRACSGNVNSHIWSHLSVVRILRGKKYQPCRVCWNDTREIMFEVSSHQLEGGKRMVDRSTENPEYLFAYSTPNVDDDDGLWASSLKLFKEVAISGNTLPGYPHERDPRAFRRSFAFILSVTRNRRFLLAYNWKRNLFKNIVSSLVEKEKLRFRSVESSVDALQRHCLKEIAPRCNASVAALSPTRNSMPHSNEKDKAKVTEPVTVANAKPARRATRPLSIRRPKLIGVSVEGSAAKALAASRERASSKLFRGGANAALSKKEEQSAMAVKTPMMTAVASMNPSANPTELQQKTKQHLPCLSNVPCLTRTRAKQRFARTSHIAALCLSMSRQKRISLDEASFLFNFGPAPLSWSEVLDVFDLPENITCAHLLSFAKALCGWVVDLHIVTPLDAGTKAQSESVAITGVFKRARTFRCRVIIRLTLEGSRIRSSGKILTLDRKKIVLRRHKQREMESISLNTLAGDMHRALSLDIFDYYSSMAEAMVKAPGEVSGRANAICLINWLNSHFAMGRRGNYKIFYCSADTASYYDSFIDDFGTAQLFRWLFANHNSNTLPCGGDTLLLTQEVVIRGTRSLCFLSCDSCKPGTMKLLFLCRSEGRNLSELTFRESSCVASSIKDQIATDGAGLMLQELRNAATRLRLQRLWKVLSGSLNTEPSQLDLQAVLELSCVRSLTTTVTANFDVKLAGSLLAGRKWGLLLRALQNDPAFSPSYELLRGGASRQRLFYLQSADIFVSLSKTSDDDIISIDALYQEHTTEGVGVTVAQRVCNFFILFLWNDLLQECHE